MKSGWLGLHSLADGRVCAVAVLKAERRRLRWTMVWVDERAGWITNFVNTLPSSIVNQIPKVYQG
jgi:hypothetical protein